MSFEMTTAPLAASDLAAIVDYLMRFDEELALRVRDEILEYIGRLQLNPFVGDIIKSRRNRTTRETRYKAYRIFFRVSEADQTIRILRIRHYKRPPLKSLE